MKFTSLELRDGLSTFATGVTIVTALDQAGKPIGMTASSFNSVSMDPPLVLWSVTKENLSAPGFKAAIYFAVHVLSVDQVDLSNRFAQRGADKFAELSYAQDSNGVPVFDGSACRFDCKTWQVYDGGDHWIIVGEVISLDKSNTESLVFSAGSYATTTAIRTSQPTSEMPEGISSPIDDLLIYHLSRAYHQVAKSFHSQVSSSGLSVPEWRVLASLYGGVTRGLLELSERSFVETWALPDLLQTMQIEGLCLVKGDVVEGDGDDISVSATTKGQDRVQHLFELGAKMDRKVLANSDEGDLEQLISLLDQVVAINS